MIVLHIQNVSKNKWERNPIGVFKLLIIFHLILLTSSCSTITTYTPDGTAENRSIEEFKLYAEEVFRRQNRISTELIMLLIDYDIDSKEKQHQLIVDAEEKITDACQPLNTMVIMKVENRDIDMSLKFKIVDSISKCDYITREVEVMLKELFG